MGYSLTAKSKYPEKELTPQQYFDKLKEKKHHIDDEGLLKV